MKKSIIILIFIKANFNSKKIKYLMIIIASLKKYYEC